MRGKVAYLRHQNGFCGIPLPCFKKTTTMCGKEVTPHNLHTSPSRKQLRAMLRSKAKENTTNGSVDFVDQSGKRVPGTGHGSSGNSQQVQKKSPRDLALKALKDSMSSSCAVNPYTATHVVTGLLTFQTSTRATGRTSGRKPPIHRTIWLHWLRTERSISGAGSKVFRAIQLHETL